MIYKHYIDLCFDPLKHRTSRVVSHGNSRWTTKRLWQAASTLGWREDWPAMSRVHAGSMFWDNLKSFYGRSLRNVQATWRCESARFGMLWVDQDKCVFNKCGRVIKTSAPIQCREKLGTNMNQYHEQTSKVTRRMSLCHSMSRCVIGLSKRL